MAIPNIYDATSASTSVGAPTFADFYKSQGITDEMFQGFNSGEQANILKSFEGLQANPTDLSNQVQSGNAAQGLGDPTKLSDMADTGLAVGQLGLGVASFLDSKKTAGLNRDLMNQNLANNAYLMKKGKEDSAHLTSVFG